MVWHLDWPEISARPGSRWKRLRQVALPELVLQRNGVRSGLIRLSQRHLWNVVGPLMKLPQRFHFSAVNIDDSSRVSSSVRMMARVCVSGADSRMVWKICRRPARHRQRTGRFQSKNQPHGHASQASASWHEGAQHTAITHEILNYALKIEQYLSAGVCVFFWRHTKDPPE